MNLDEMAALSSSLVAPLHSLVLTGGEPFLRNDLYEICALFHRRNRVHTVFLPTNGLLTDAITNTVARICTELPLNVYVQISLDDFPGRHDALRGVEGCFHKAVAAAQTLKAMQARFPRLYVTLATTLHAGNVSRLEALASFVQHELALPQTFELVRGAGFRDTIAPSAAELVAHAPADPAVRPVPLEELDALCRRLAVVFWHNAKLAAGGNPVLAPLVYAYRVARYQHLRDVLRRRRPFRCPAGSTTGVVYPDGQVAFCEFLPPVGDLRDADYDFRAVWHAPAAEAMRARVRHCYCTHSCFQAVAMMREWRVYAWLAYHASRYLLATLVESRTA